MPHKTYSLPSWDINHLLISAPSYGFNEWSLFCTPDNVQLDCMFFVKEIKWYGVPETDEYKYKMEQCKKCVCNFKPVTKSISPSLFYVKIMLI